MKIDDVKVGAEYAHEQWGRVLVTDIVTVQQTGRRGYRRDVVTRNIRMAQITILDEETGQPRQGGHIVASGYQTLASHLPMTWSNWERRENIKAAAERPCVEVAAALQERLRLSLAAAPNRLNGWDAELTELVDAEPGWSSGTEADLGDGLEPVRYNRPESAYVEVTMSQAQASLLAEILDQYALAAAWSSRSVATQETGGASC